jgi:flagellar basal-body rod protein FlgB
MFAKLDLFRIASAMASHAGQRQGVIATNIANADTPGYRARDLRPFADVYRQEGATTMRVTRAGHLPAAGPSARADTVLLDNPDQSLNGNTVSLEDQMLRGVDVRRQHSRALAIYRSGLTVLRASLGRG